MKFKIIVIILLLLLVVIFALQNTEIVGIKLWFWEVKTPRALLILLCITLGVIIGMISSKCNFKMPKKENKHEE
ncbi:MAG: LapA family protein [Bacteroidales bacterium]|nr:LapA family protein [Bacteroidales bacterium]